MEENPGNYKITISLKVDPESGQTLLLADARAYKGHSKIFYSLNKGKVLKRTGSAIFELVFDNTYTNTISPLDNMVFKRFSESADSLYFNNIMKPKKATGFILVKTTNP